MKTIGMDEPEVLYRMALPAPFSMVIEVAELLVKHHGKENVWTSQVGNDLVFTKKPIGKDKRTPLIVVQ